MKKEEVEKLFELNKKFSLYCPLYKSEDYIPFGKEPDVWVFQRIAPKKSRKWRFRLENEAGPIKFEGKPYFNTKGDFSAVGPTSDDKVYDFVLELPDNQHKNSDGKQIYAVVTFYEGGAWTGLHHVVDYDPALMKSVEDEVI